MYLVPRSCVLSRPTKNARAYCLIDKQYIVHFIRHNNTSMPTAMYMPRVYSYCRPFCLQNDIASAATDYCSHVYRYASSPTESNLTHYEYYYYYYCIPLKTFTKIEKKNTCDQWTLHIILYKTTHPDCPISVQTDLLPFFTTRFLPSHIR